MSTPTLSNAQHAALSPFADTFLETAAHYDLTPSEFAQAADVVGATGCPWFSVHIYTRTHVACAAIERGDTPEDLS